jgi:hypothetical protein
MASKNRFGTASGGKSWREQLSAIQEARTEFQRFHNIMTPYERATIAESIKRRADTARVDIARGAIDEFKASIDAFKNAQKKVDEARRKQMNSWEPGRLADEMKLAQVFVDTALTSQEPQAELRRIYEEAKFSEDGYKQRAMGEAIRAATGKVNQNDLDLLRAVNSITRQAERDLESLRITPEVEEAHQEAEAAFNAHMDLRRELTRTAEALNDTAGPISRALVRVQYNESGPTIDIDVTGELTAEPGSDITELIMNAGYGETLE